MVGSNGQGTLATRNRKEGETTPECTETGGNWWRWRQLGPQREKQPAMGPMPYLDLIQMVPELLANNASLAELKFGGHSIHAIPNKLTRPELRTARSWRHRALRPLLKLN